MKKGQTERTEKGLMRDQRVKRQLAEDHILENETTKAVTSGIKEPENKTVLNKYSMLE